MDERRLAALTATLERHGQRHLLDGLSGLEPAIRERFLDRVAEVDWAELERHAEPPSLDVVEPPAVVTLAERTRRADTLFAAGERAYRDGRVAVVVVAGGQGTRLGFPGPKGCFPLAPHTGKSIYQLQAEKIVSLSRRVGRAVPFLVMTSPATDAETRAFFDEHGGFGLAEGQARLFVQGTLPSLDLCGKALLAAPGRLLANPDGHGGSFTALADGGLLDDLGAAGFTHFVYV
jgi:UDP-N-acetylglucosamine/UDP-N-acetylgalactosamine diphosphorylase